MKLRIAILAALALIAFDRISAAEESSQSLLIKVADQVDLNGPPWPNKQRHARHGRGYYRPYGGLPVACESVIFPRSPLCAGRPAAFGPFAPFPWEFRWYD
jgi:hypothetical protein